MITNEASTHQKNLLPIFPLVLLRGFNQIAVVAAFFQFHHNIKEAGCAAPRSFGKSLVIPGQNPLVILFLKGRHLHPENLLHFGRKGFLHILFDSPEKERL